ncbi:MAG: glutamyl-tRNA reductase [Verrucomicrobia bacterium]|nr:glutamyl-tRNA reductase [Verrucomicrobiota bacterium]
MQRIYMAGLSYRTAPVAIREQFAVAPSAQAGAAERVRRRFGFAEAVLLWTCNRVEVYAVGGAARPAPGELFSCLADRPLDAAAGFYACEGRHAVQHLFHVASGMDSMVLGETEVTGQVKNAYEKARAEGHTGPRLNRLFQKALETAKEVRTRTAIGKGAASVGSVAVRHAQRTFGASLAGRKVMVIGAGDMAAKCLRHFAKKGASSIKVVNRSVDKAEQLAAQFGGTAVSFGRCLEAMADIDIVLTSTGCPHVILERSDIETVMAGRAGRPLVLMDIAVPRDVAADVRDIPGVHLFDIGDMEETVRESIRYREQDLDLCGAIIDAKVDEFEDRLVAAGRDAEPAAGPCGAHVEHAVEASVGEQGCCLVGAVAGEC